MKGLTTDAPDTLKCALQVESLYGIAVESEDFDSQEIYGFSESDELYSSANSTGPTESLYGVANTDPSGDSLMYDVVTSRQLHNEAIFGIASSGPGCDSTQRENLYGMQEASAQQIYDNGNESANCESAYGLYNNTEQDPEYENKSGVSDDNMKTTIKNDTLQRPIYETGAAVFTGALLRQMPSSLSTYMDIGALHIV